MNFKEMIFIQNWGLTLISFEIYVMKVKQHGHWSYKNSTKLFCHIGKTLKPYFEF